MQLRRSFFPILAQSLVFSWAPLASALTLEPLDEPLTQLVSPFMQYSLVGSNYVAEPTTATPLLCGNTSAPASAYAPISPIYYSPTGVGPQKPFVFGASAATPTVPAFALGASMAYGDTMQLVGDPSLVCYGLDANGVHGPTPHTFLDAFEGPQFSPATKTVLNSSVTLTVFHVPTSGSDYYGYAVDVNIPALPAGIAATCAPAGTVDCNFALLEGFDTSVFSTNSGHSDEGWCIGSAPGTSCITSVVNGGININYSNWTNGVVRLNADTGVHTFRFIVKRYFQSGVSAMPANGGPVAIAALFSPFDLEEPAIADNVSIGYGNTPPSVVQSGDAWSTFSSHLSTLAENTDSGVLAFNITDADTAEPGAGPFLRAAVTLNLNGLSVPVTPTCSVVAGSGAANRQCTLDVNFANPTWWDSAVSDTYKGQGNLFATDPGGVSASASIVVTDSLGKVGAPVSLPLHVASTVNSAPVVSINAPFALAVDPHDNGSYPTYTCSVSAGAGAGGCGAPGRGNIEPVLNGAVGALPGPAAAFDELFTQTTAVVPYVDPNDGFTNVNCVAEQATPVFVPSGGPIAAGSGGSFNLDFVLPGLAPVTSVSTLCTITITDAMASFPAGESPKTTARQFRIVVNP